jgi:hypothetical protein
MGTAAAAAAAVPGTLPSRPPGEDGRGRVLEGEEGVRGETRGPGPVGEGGEAHISARTRARIEVQVSAKEVALSALPALSTHLGRPVGGPRVRSQPLLSSPHHRPAQA